jgi:hypothetical protein
VKEVLESLIQVTLRHDGIPGPLMAFFRKLVSDGLHFPDGYLFKARAIAWPGS